MLLRLSLCILVIALTTTHSRMGNTAFFASLLIAGVSTSGCIRATAVDACQHGFIPLVVREAVGDRHPAPHEANLFDLQAKYAEVVGLQLAMDYLQGLGERG